MRGQDNVVVPVPLNQVQVVRAPAKVLPRQLALLGERVAPRTASRRRRGGPRGPLRRLPRRPVLETRVLVAGDGGGRVVEARDALGERRDGLALVDDERRRVVVGVARRRLGAPDDAAVLDRVGPGREAAPDAARVLVRPRVVHAVLSSTVYE